MKTIYPRHLEKRFCIFGCQILCITDLAIMHLRRPSFLRTHTLEYKEWLEKNADESGHRSGDYSYLHAGRVSGKCREVCSTIHGIKNCEAICYSDTPGIHFVKVYVAVVMPRVAPSGVYAFNLCEDGRCVNSGTVSTIGGTTALEKLLQKKLLTTKSSTS